MSAMIHWGAFLATLGPGELVGLVTDSTFFGKFILLVLLVLSVWLYRRTNPPVPPWLKAVLLGLRFSVVTSLAVSVPVIEGNIAFMTWNAESPDRVYEFRTDTYIVEDGQIVAQTYGALTTEK